MIRSVKIINHRLEKVFDLTPNHNIEIEYENGDKLLIEPRWTDSKVVVNPNKHFSSNRDVKILTHKFGISILHEDE
jgi:hypothetical protein